MPIDVYEMYNSRKLNLTHDSQSATLEFFSKGSTDEEEVRAAFQTEIPATFESLVIDNLDTECIGGDFWRATATYKSLSTALVEGGVGDPGNPPPEPGEPGGPPVYTSTDALGAEFAFDISGVSEHITQSKSTRSKTKRGGGAAADNKQAIGVTVDGEVKGCDRISPNLEYSVTITVGFITFGYLNTLYQLVGKVNNATFNGFAAGEVLLVGVSGQSRDVSKYTLTFKFACRPNEEDIDICGDASLVVDKEGWQYLWISYKNVEDAAQIFMQPDAAYVERIYDSGNFALLGIGT